RPRMPHTRGRTRSRGFAPDSESPGSSITPDRPRPASLPTRVPMPERGGYLLKLPIIPSIARDGECPSRAGRRGRRRRAIELLEPTTSSTQGRLGADGPERSGTEDPDPPHRGWREGPRRGSDRGRGAPRDTDRGAG